MRIGVGIDIAEDINWVTAIDRLATVPDLRAIEPSSEIDLEIRPLVGRRRDLGS